MSIEQLRRQRGSIKAKLTSTRNFANRIEDDLKSTTREEIESRRVVEEVYVKFQAISQQLATIVPEEEYEQRDLVEETEFEDRYFELTASLSQYLAKLRPTPQASTSGNGNQVSENALAQVLEQQVILMQRLSERSNDVSSNDVLSRILEQQGQMLERLSMQSRPRESQVKLPIIKLPTFNGTIEEWKRYADTFKTLIHDSDLSNVQKH
ncbi:unnamed protein product [Lasius platythorax]|uniref:Uncharacterized protein n=1 Tax=Lasius platythorax TaxID=488582 RepID=A0AAV2NX97_9HYME